MKNKLIKTFEEANLNCLAKLAPNGTGNLALVKEYLSSCMNVIEDIHNAGGAGMEVAALRSIAIDRLISALFDLAGREYCLKYTKADQKCTIVALGGYGRGELSPASDIDLMFLYPWKVGSYTETVIERILYILWDTGLDVGYSTRNISECIKVSSDLVAKTSLIDSRYLCGDEALFDDYKKAVSQQLFSKNVDAFIQDKVAEAEERRKKYGDSVYILEPDIKEGDGGLRDLHTALWAAKVKFKVDDFKDLNLKGILSDSEYTELSSVFEFMLRLRNEMHFTVKRKSEQLSFELQEKISKKIGYVDKDGSLAVEQLMKEYYLTANRIKELSGIIIERCLNKDARRSLGKFIRQRDLSDGFKLFGGDITISDKDLFKKRPSAMMRLFELSQLHGVQIHSFARERLRENLDRIDDDFRASPDVNRSFMNILKSEWDVTGTLKLMHKLEVIDRFIPEFGEVRCQVQHDIYHIYTVDTHSLFAVEELRRLMLGEQKEAYPLRTALMEELERPEVLYLAALLHDVGKGKGGRHEEIGAEIAARVAGRIGFSKEDIDDIEFLVLSHLRLSHTAQRRDLNDPKLILDFAMEMGTLERAKMLYLLTYADIRAIGPDVWTEWKSALFHELYTKTAEVFEMGTFEVEDAKEKIAKVALDVEHIIGKDYPTKDVRAFTSSMPERYLLSKTPKKISEHFMIAMRYTPPLSIDLKHNERRGYTRLIVTTIDSPSLFYKISGVLAGNGITILGADIYTRKNGEVLDIFHVKSAIENLPIDQKRWARVEGDLLDVIQGERKAEDVMKEYCKPSILDDKYSPKIKPRVIINNEISDSNTVVEIHAQDRVGLLYTISKILVKQGLYIEVSKISTMGEKVTDVFYLKDIFGQKIFYREKLDEIKKELEDALEEEGLCQP